MLPVPLDVAINARIAQSSVWPRGGALGNYQNLVAQGTFIDNAWGNINATQIGRPTGPGNSAVAVMKDTMSPDGFKPVLTHNQEVALGWPGGRPAMAEVEKQFLMWGAAKAIKAPFFGVCEGFACVTIAVLCATNSPVPGGTLIEWVGLVPNNVVGRGHVFTVVGRTPGTALNNPAAWGANCLVVDPWYALQTGVNPAMFVNGPNANAGFVNWLTAANVNVRLLKDFTVGAYNYLNVKTI